MGQCVNRSACFSANMLLRLVGDHVEQVCKKETGVRYHRADDSIGKKYRLTTKILGVGISGPVRLAQEKQSGAKVVVKSLSISFYGNARKEAKHLGREIEILLSAHHPHIVRLLDAYESLIRVDLVLELLQGGTLQSCLSARSLYSENEAACTAHQMFIAVDYLHNTLKVVHRDLKPDNFMYMGPRAGEGILKLIDFGFSKYFKEGKLITSYKGTLFYVAPEVLDESYTNKCDIWSLGVIVFRTLLGYLPFEDRTPAHPMVVQAIEDRIRRLIRKGQFIIQDCSQWNRLTDVARKFVSSLLQVSPTQRPSATEALHSPWLAARSEAQMQVYLARSTLDEKLASALSKGALTLTFTRACLMLMAWSSCQEDCENEVDEKGEDYSLRLSSRMELFAPFRKGLNDPESISNPECRRLFNVVLGIQRGETDQSDLLAAMLPFEDIFIASSLADVFHLIEKDYKGYITPQDFADIFGDEFGGSSAETIITQASNDSGSCLAFGQYQRHLFANVA